MRSAVKLVLAASLGLLLIVSVADASSPPSAVLTVSATADVVNGDVSSPAALIARPGSDGISLREAIMAADKAAGRVGITFAPSLSGQTIMPTAKLPPFTHDGIALIGSTTPDGQPAVTLDASLRTQSCCGALLSVYASDATISHLRIVGGRDEAISVITAAPNGETAVHDVRIEANLLDNGGGPGGGIAVGTDFPGDVDGVPYAGATDASIVNLTIAHNVIRGYTGDGINVTLASTRCLIDNLQIEDNTLADETGASDPALEIGAIFTGNRITGTRIVRNTFTNDHNGLFIDGGLSSVNQATGATMPATGNTVSGTVVSQNVFDGGANALQIVGGLGLASASGNSVLDTEISNNVVVHGSSMRSKAFYVTGGEDGASGNRVEGLRLVNDTFVFNIGGALSLDDGGSANAIANVVVDNSISWMNGPSPDIVAKTAAVSPAVRNSLIGVDPQFVSAQDLHLQSGSPAINAGSATGAPAFDIDNGVRDSTPDIGAYEFGAAPRPRLSVYVEELGGTGTVSSTPAGIACESVCEVAFDNNTPVTLTAAPAAGSVFTGWSGACSGTAACMVTLTTAATVSATFAPPAAKPAPKLAPKCKKGQKSTAKHRCRHV
jgi:hypothetical protein